MRQVTRRSAASGLRYLLEGVRSLTASLPDLHDAFDADGLPIAFILRRDSRLDAAAAPWERLSTRVRDVGGRRTGSFHTHRRGGPRRQMSDE
jgi:uncharacterized protein (DUF2461 family)